MSRVYLEYSKSVILKHPDYFMTALFIASAFSAISFKSVLMNMPKDSFGHIFSFMLSAFKNTDWFIQALIGGFFVRLIVGNSMANYHNIQKTGLGGTSLSHSLKSS